MNGVLALRLKWDLRLVPLSTLANGTSMHVISQCGLRQVTAWEPDTSSQKTTHLTFTILKGDLMLMKYRMIRKPLERPLALRGLENASWASIGWTRMNSQLLTLTTRLFLSSEIANPTYLAFSDRKFSGLCFVILMLALQWQMLLRQSSKLKLLTMIRQQTTSTLAEEEIALTSLE